MFIKIQKKKEKLKKIYKFEHFFQNSKKINVHQIANINFNKNIKNVNNISKKLQKFQNEFPGF